MKLELRFCEGTYENLHHIPHHYVCDGDEEEEGAWKEDL